MRLAISTVVAVIACIAGATFANTAAASNLLCEGSFGNYGPYAATTTNEYSEVDASLTTRNPTLCSGNDGGRTPMSLMWVMLDSHTLPDYHAQAGWKKTPNGTTGFTEIIDPN